MLAVAAVAKARDFGSFRRTVDALVPSRRAVAPAAVSTVVTEAVLAALLVTGVAASAVAAVTVVLFLAFAALSYWAIRRGVHLQCNCFGAGERELGKESLETSLLLAAATLAYWVLLRRVEPSPTLGELPLAVFLGVAAVVGARWLLAAGALLGIVRQRRRLESDLAQ